MSEYLNFPDSNLYMVGVFLRQVSEPLLKSLRLTNRSESERKQAQLREPNSSNNSLNSN